MAKKRTKSRFYSGKFKNIRKNSTFFEPFYVFYQPVGSKNNVLALLKVENIHGIQPTYSPSF